MKKNKHAILVGSIAGGFCIEQIVSDAEAAESFVANYLANGKLAEAIEIQLPSSLGKKEKDHDCGIDYIVFGSGLGNGFSMFGPFPDWELSNDFGESHRDEDEEWECFQFERQDVPTMGDPQ